MASREYEISTATLAKVPKDSRVDLAWQVVQKFARGLSLGNAPPNTIDPAKIVDEMTKAKKEVSMVAIVKELSSLTIEARVSGKKVSTPWSVDITSGKDAKKWLVTLTALNSYNTKLVTDEELKKFVKDHPDPVVLAALRKDIADLDKEIKEAKTKRDAKQKEYTDMGGK